MKQDLLQIERRRLFEFERGKQEISKSIIDAVLDYISSLNPEISTENLSVEDPENIAQIIFKVQIAASSNKVAPMSYNFKGLSPISRIKLTSVYRYFYGETTDYNKAKELKKSYWRGILLLLL